MDITLIVKASNQQFDDQTIKCEPSWTIRRLKGHLTEVYPGKPTTDEQKLIYSGQLLGDSVVLKDILRHYDGQQAHTVHLVFTPKNNRHRDFNFNNSNSGGSSNSNKTMSPKASSESGATSTAASSRGSSAGPVRSPEPGTDGLRQRNVTGGQSSNAAPTMDTSPMSPASADYIMGQHLAMQNWMQQAYMQYLNQYMNVISNGQNPQPLYASAPTNQTNPTIPQPSLQANVALQATPANPNPILAQTLPNLAYYPYLSTMNSSPMPSASSIPAPITSSGSIPTSPASPVAGVTAAGPSSQPTIPSSASSSPASAAASPVMPGTSPASSPSSSTANAASTGTAAAAATAVEDTSAQAQPAPAADAAPAAAAAPARRFPNIVVEEQENRDWLDIFFSLCRVGILMTVVYLYSSPTRCLTVFLIGISLYLYQIGFFRNNNTDRLERARRMVVQQMNNAHGIRPRAPLAPAGGEPAANAQAPAIAPEPTAAATAATNATAKADTDTTDGAKPAESGSPAEIQTSASTEESPVEETTLPTVAVESNAAAEEQTAEPSAIVPETSRVNLNDVAGFLRTLVLSFFTSIIPDMPAA